MPPRVSVCLGEGSRSLSLLLFPGRSTRWRAWALVSLRGGALNGVRLDAPGTVAGLARTAQFGELLDFDRTSNLVDGVLRTSVRGWCLHHQRVESDGSDDVTLVTDLVLGWCLHSGDRSLHGSRCQACSTREFIPRSPVDIFAPPSGPFQLAVSAEPGRTTSYMLTSLRYL